MKFLGVKVRVSMDFRILIPARGGSKGIKLKKGELILTGAFGPPIPIQDKKLVECKSSALGSVSATFL